MKKNFRTTNLEIKPIKDNTRLKIQYLVMESPGQIKTLAHENSSKPYKPPITKGTTSLIALIPTRLASCNQAPAIALHTNLLNKME